MMLVPQTRACLHARTQTFHPLTPALISSHTNPLKHPLSLYRTCSRAMHWHLYTRTQREAELHELVTRPSREWRLAIVAVCPSTAERAHIPHTLRHLRAIALRHKVWFISTCVGLGLSQRDDGRDAREGAVDGDWRGGAGAGAGGGERDFGGDDGWNWEDAEPWDRMDHVLPPSVHLGFCLSFFFPQYFCQCVCHCLCTMVSLFPPFFTSIDNA